MENGGIGGLALVLVGLNLIWQVTKGGLLTRIGFLKP